MPCGVSPWTTRRLFPWSRRVTRPRRGYGPRSEAWNWSTPSCPPCPIHGFTDEQVVDAYRSFTSFLLGQLLLESAMRGAETSPVDVPLDEGNAQIPNEDGQVDLRSSSNVARLRPLLSEDRSQEEFETTLETLLDRLELSLSQ
jgi:hypothetical protein